jgi:carbonic anhydrase/acetyltransferase-like protein (isoleucine patch superfamily)
VSGTGAGTIQPFEGHEPKLAENVFVAPGATVIGDVEIGADTNIWFGCVVRGDVNLIRIGAGTNIQDGTVVHVSYRTHPTHIGSNVSIGHAALLHGCTLEDNAFIGMRATVMDGTVVEGGAMVAAGALVTPGKRVPAGQLWAGSPARFSRPLKGEELDYMRFVAPHYVELARKYRERDG